MEKPADKAAFLAGKQCILYYPGFQVPDGYVGEKNIHFSCGGKQFSISIAAVCHEWYYGGTRNIGPNLIVSQDSQGNMMEIGIVISLLLLLVGALNYGNTMAASLQSRKLTFAIMESLGMSDRQIRKLLVREGLLVILCIGVPLLSYRRLRGNPSIVERLREYEE